MPEPVVEPHRSVHDGDPAWDRREFPLQRALPPVHADSTHSMLQGIARSLLRSEDDDHARERAVVLTSYKLDSTANESDRSLHAVVVPPRRVSPRRDETDDSNPLEGFPVCLFYPARYVASVGRIHPASSSSSRKFVPLYRECVHVLGYENGTFSIGGRCAHVHPNSELLSQWLEDLSWSFPVLPT